MIVKLRKADFDMKNLNILLNSNVNISMSLNESLVLSSWSEWEESAISTSIIHIPLKS